MINASTDIRLKGLTKSPVEVIELWLDNGWCAHDAEGKVFYLPLHDDGDFDWQRKPFSEWDSIRAELEEKAKLGEIIGLELTWRGTSHGGNFHFNFSPNLISISWLADRKPHPDGSEKSDLEWYEPKVVGPLLEAGLEVVSVLSEDEDSGGKVINRSFHEGDAVQRLKP